MLTGGFLWALQALAGPFPLSFPGFPGTPPGRVKSLGPRPLRYHSYRLSCGIVGAWAPKISRGLGGACAGPPGGPARAPGSILGPFARSSGGSPGAPGDDKAGAILPFPPVH
eukprot:9002654-Pyramimonas_sp.AAC.1